MARLIDSDNIVSICNSITDVDVYSLIAEILEWQDTLEEYDRDDAVTYSVLDSVIDMILYYADMEMN